MFVLLMACFHVMFLMFLMFLILLFYVVDVSPNSNGWSLALDIVQFRFYLPLSLDMQQTCMAKIIYNFRCISDDVLFLVLVEVILVAVEYGQSIKITSTKNIT